MYETETFEYCDQKVIIGIEEYIDDFHNPRQWDNVGIMYCWHPDYILGDKMFTRSDFNSLAEVERYLREEEKALVILPLSLYEHSGITMFIGHRDYVFDPGGWDTTYCGFIYTTQERLDKMGAKLEDAERILEQEVKTYASYLEGEVYTYVVEDHNGNMLDSCGGYIGDIEYVRSEAKQSAEWNAEAIKREQNAVRYWAERDVLTVS